MRRLPSLPSLGGLGAWIDPDQLRSLGIATAGGALGAVVGNYAVDFTTKAPMVGGLPKPVHYGVIGAIGALAVSWGASPSDWRTDLAKGLAGHLIGGQAVGGFVLGLLGRSLGALPEEEALSQIPGEDELSQLPDDDLPAGVMDDDASVDPAELAELSELVPEQQFDNRAGLGVSVERGSLGSWLS